MSLEISEISTSQSEDIKLRDLDKPNSLIENSETSTSQIIYGELEISISQYTYRDVKTSICLTGDLETKSQSHEMLESLEVKHEQQEPHLAPSDHEIPPVETRGEVPVVELPFSPEEEKPKFNLLFLFEHAVEPNTRDKFHLMIVNIWALRELGDDYQSFNKAVFKFISQQQELEFAAKDVEIGMTGT
ncbi:hypothetical protein AgCh_024408 [Apium graveolens]